MTCLHDLEVMWAHEGGTHSGLGEALKIEANSICPKTKLCPKTNSGSFLAFLFVPGKLTPHSLPGGPENPICNLNKMSLQCRVGKSD